MGNFYSCVIKPSGVLGLVLLIHLAVAAKLFSAEPAGESVNLGSRSLQQGDFEEAIVRWTDAIDAYEKSGNPKGKVEALIKRAQSYQAIGQHRAALKDLESAQEIAKISGDRRQMTLTLASLGNLYMVTGPAEEANRHLQQSLGLAKELKSPEMLAVVYNNLGNLLASQKKWKEAVSAYDLSATHAATASDDLLAATALTNEANASRESSNFDHAKKLLDRAQEQIKKSNPSHDKVYALLNIGLAYNSLRPHLRNIDGALLQQAFESLNQAAVLAVDLNDRRGVSYSWGYLGNLYESETRQEEALELTRRAMLAAQQIHAPESLFKWQWQAGRVLKALGRNDDALLSYRRAITTLHSIRAEFLQNYTHPGESFRDTLGPLYFQMVDLLLKNADATPDAQINKTYLTEAREVIESFKVAELRDYFRDDCVDTALSKLTTLDVISNSAVIIYPILLADRTELLVTLPTGLKRYSVPVGSARLTEEVRQFRRRLEKRTTREYLPHAQRLYDWLIRPVEPDLASMPIDTLVFVPDGPLRTVPIAALHDGKQFLVAKYGLATTPGLNLTDPQPIQRETTKVLAVGITEAVQGFPPLPFVSQELDAIKGLFGSNFLINEEFRTASLEEKLKDEKITILHVASHGEFSRDASQTFLLAFKDKITMDRLDQLIGLFRFRDNPLELLTLSACDTAAGDDRAALGLAGVAIKAGARSAVATLWNVNDEASADLVAEFYREIKASSTSRAAALQRAQLKIISDPRFDHPGFWSAFILINNWL